MSRLWVLRHAPVTTVGLCYGRFDPPRRSVLMGGPDGLELPPVDRIWSSPSPRCAELAAELHERDGLPVHLDERLYELDFGRWEGIPWASIPEQELEAWGEHWRTCAPPDGETLPELEARVRAWHAELAPEDRHLLVAHAGVVRCLWVQLEGLDWPRALDRPVPHLTPFPIPGTR